MSADATTNDRLPDAPTRLVGCPDCDLLIRLAPPRPHETARCPRCRCALTSSTHDGFVRPLAFAVAALTLLAVALTSPFLGVNAAGLTNVMTLATAVTSLQRFGADGIAVVFTAFVLLLPGVMMLATAALTALLVLRRGSPLLAPVARALFRLDAWCMAEVFIVGVIVSLVKLSTLADVVVGAAFWAYLGFAGCFLIAVTHLDRLAVWSAIDALGQSR